MEPNLFESAIKIISAHPGLKIFFGDVFGPAAKGICERASVGLENIRDWNGQKLNSQILGQLPGIGAAAFGGVRSGHGNAEDIFAAQGCHGDGGHDGGIDAAAEAHDHGAKTGLANVVARSADERLKDEVQSRSAGCG